MSLSWDDEVSLIKKAADRYGLQWQFLAAIRKQENGGLGREFGVLGVSAPTYDDQLRSACASVKHRLVQYDQSHGGVLYRYIAPNGDAVVIYSPAFIDWFANIWAPVGADNDPHHLNRNWANGVKWWYCHLLDADHQVSA